MYFASHKENNSSDYIKLSNLWIYSEKEEEEKVFISSSFYVVLSNHDYLQNSLQVALSPRSEVFLALSSEQASQFWVGTCQIHPIVQLFSQCGPQNSSSSSRDLV